MATNGTSSNGKADPVRVTVTMNTRPPLIGRDKEWAALYETISRRHASFILVEGELGGGRSRFVSDAGERLAAEGFTVLTGKVLERAHEPMKVFHDVARQIFGIGAQPLGARNLMARVIDRLHSIVGTDQAMATYFGAFLRGVEMGEIETPTRDYLWFRLLAAIAAIDPVVLVLDDLQWSSGESVDLAETLIRRAREEDVPLQVVAATLATDADERTRARIRPDPDSRLSNCWW